MKKKMEKPAKSFMRMKDEKVKVGLYIMSDVKQEAQKAAIQIGTSLNNMCTSALKWYVAALKKEGSIK